MGRRPWVIWASPVELQGPSKEGAGVRVREGDVRTEAERGGDGMWDHEPRYARNERRQHNGSAPTPSRRNQPC